MCIYDAKFVCFFPSLFQYVINNTRRIFQPIADNDDGNAAYYSPRYVMQMQSARHMHRKKKHKGEARARGSKEILALSTPCNPFFVCVCVFFFCSCQDLSLALPLSPIDASPSLVHVLCIDESSVCVSRLPRAKERGTKAKELGINLSTRLASPSFSYASPTDCCAHCVNANALSSHV